jgi:hypothetical protein
MLTIRIHRQDMREACRLRGAQSLEDGGTFPAIARQNENLHAGIERRQILDRGRRLVRAAINDDPDKRPKRARRAHRLDEFRAGVVTRNKDEVSRQGRPCASFSSSVGVGQSAPIKRMQIRDKIAQVAINSQRWTEPHAIDQGKAGLL